MEEGDGYLITDVSESECIFAKKQDALYVHLCGMVLVFTVKEHYSEFDVWISRGSAFKSKDEIIDGGGDRYFLIGVIDGKLSDSEECIKKIGKELNTMLWKVFLIIDERDVKVIVKSLMRFFS